MKLHLHHSTSNSVQIYEIRNIPYQGTDSLKFRQPKGNNSCISETIVTNFDVHQHTVAIYIITIIRPLAGYGLPPPTGGIL